MRCVGEWKEREVLATSALRKRCWSGEVISDSREEILSWVREHPITVWPLFASSRARALPNPLPTPVISTVFATELPFRQKGAVDISLSLSFPRVLCLRCYVSLIIETETERKWEWEAGSSLLSPSHGNVYRYL